MPNVAVSVLIRTTGRQIPLAATLQSLRAQTFRDFEVVVVEDGPPTLPAFLETFSDLPLRYESLQVRRGRSAAGNHALKIAQGEYGLFLDDDDLILPNHLQFLVKAAQAGKYKIVCSWSEERAVERAADGRIIRAGRFARRRRENFSALQLIAGNFLPINAVLFHRSLYERAGGFDTDLDILEDWMLWLRYVAVEPSWGQVKQATAVYHVPFLRERNARRQVFRLQHEKIRERMRNLSVTWNMEMLNRDLMLHFPLPLYLRKLYYLVTGYIPL